MTRYPQVLVMLILALSIVTASAAEVSEHGTISTATIASDAFTILGAVPDKGIEESSAGLQEIIAQRQVLERSSNLLHRQLALILADAVAFAIVREIQNTEMQRMGAAQSPVHLRPAPPKNVVVQLWKANDLDAKSAIRASSHATGDVVRFAFQDSSEDEILDGRMIKKASADVLPRIRELQRNAREYRGLGRAPSADELLMQTLVTAQAFRDLRVIVDLFESGDLPQERALLQSAIEGALSLSQARRMDDGMKASSLKVLSTFGRYCLPDHDAYRLKMALLLGPYMTDRSALPEAAKRIFEEFGASIE